MKVVSNTALHTCTTLIISESVTDKGLVPRTTNRKWHMGYQMVKSRITSRDHERSNSVANALRAQYLENCHRGSVLKDHHYKMASGVSNVV